MKPILLCTAALSLWLTACGSGSKDDDAPGMAESVGQFRQATQSLGTMAEHMRQQADKPPAEPVDFRKLRALLPEQVAGLPRGEVSGKRTQMGEGLGVSQAEATYQDAAGSGRIELEISDLAGAGPMGAMIGLGMAADFEQESDRGYKRSRRVGGHPGHEEYDTRYNRGEITAFVADRFMVKVKGRDVDADQLQRAIESVDLRALETMKDEGRQ